MFEADSTHTLSSAELAALIERNDKAYWELGEPEISDENYDALTRRLAELEPHHPLLSKVSAPVVAASGKVTHKKPMLSLGKVYSLDELMTWAAKTARGPEERFDIQPKYDGISAIFADDVLATRGDGAVGENISDKIPLIELETKGHKGPLDRPARGEIVIRNDDFREIYSKITKKDGNPYKNPRNAVAGIMGLKEIDDMVRQGAKLTLVDYELVSFSAKLADLERKWPEFVENIEKLSYPMDGIVVKLADAGYYESLGATAHHPRGAVAFKFSGVRKETELLGVEWSFGKNCITPVALLEPVDIGGITIKRASLHNIQNIIDRDIRVGDTVVVERAGDVIPHIVDSTPGARRESRLISQCPSCGAKLVRLGPEIACPNPQCPETLVRRLLASVRSVGIDRLGEPNVRRMMETLNVKTLKDVFGLSLDDILKLEGFKEKSAANLHGEIQSARTVGDYKILAALNIRGIGPNVAKAILERHSLDEIRSLSVEELSKIDGIGPERAEALHSELRSQSEFLDELLGVVNVVSTKASAGASNAPTACFTGKMPEKRSYYAKLAESRGYAAADSVTSSLSLLVANDPSAGGGKLAKAAKLGVRVVSLDDWLNSPEFAQAPSPTNMKSTATPTAPKPTPEPRPESAATSSAPDEPEMEEPFLPGF